MAKKKKQKLARDQKKRQSIVRKHETEEFLPTTSKKFNVVIALNAFIIGAVIMALEMIGSRYLTPYFGSSIYIWASLISTVMVALTVGYFAGGHLVDKYPSSSLLGYLILLSALYMLFIPYCSDLVFDRLYAVLADIRYSSLVGAFIILFIPLALLSVYSPFAIRLTLSFTHQSGKTSGYFYGISTFGSIVGTLGVTFYLVPVMGSRSITYLLSLITFAVGLSFLFLPSSTHMTNANKSVLGTIVHSKFLKIFLISLLYLFIFVSITLHSSESIFGWNFFNTTQDAKSQGILLEQVESEYNNIMIYKNAEYITMKFARYDSEYTESVINTVNAHELPVPYTRVMPVGLVYTEEPKHLLMIGLGGGSTTRYIHKYFPKLLIDAVEIDRSVIHLAKKYFKVKESGQYIITERDGRIYLKNSAQKYDIIMMDAFRGGYIPFHLLTTQFNELVKQNLQEGGCVVLNLHSGTKLFDSIMATLNVSFDHVDTLSVAHTGKNIENVIAIAYQGARKSQEYLKDSARRLQKTYEFSYDMTTLLELSRKVAWDTDSKIFTDDFAPANYLNAIHEHNRKQW